MWIEQQLRTLQFQSILLIAACGFLREKHACFILISVRLCAHLSHQTIVFQLPTQLNSDVLAEKLKRIKNFFLGLFLDLIAVKYSSTQRRSFGLCC
jgi:hypothetical protein